MIVDSWDLSVRLSLPTKESALLAPLSSLPDRFQRWPLSVSLLRSHQNG